jgi:hypothetical protein
VSNEIARVVAELLGTNLDEINIAAWDVRHLIQIRSRFDCAPAFRSLPYTKLVKFRLFLQKSRCGAFYIPPISCATRGGAHTPPR